MEKIEKIALDEAKGLFEKLSISAEIKAELEDETVKLHIDTQENALLIGKHGSTLSSLETVLSLIISKKTENFVRVITEIGGYRQAREEYLTDLANRLREEVLSQEGEKQVRGLKPWERRLIHLHFSEDPDVATESVGEERDRVLVVRKK